MRAIVVRRVTPARWDDVVDLFERIGPRGGSPVTSGCWCQFWLLRGKEYDLEQGGANRARLEAQIDSGSAHALLAYDGTIPVGWCRLGPRGGFDRLEHSPRLAPVDDEDVWSVVCFYVYPSAKRQGVASALLEAAVAYAAEEGAPYLEAYPVRAGHMNLDAYTGYLPMFLAAGVDELRDAGRRVLVRRPLRGR